MKKLLDSLIRLFASYGLACVILVLLTLLTFLGTIEQTRLGLYEVQKRYFESIVVMHPLPGGIVLPLPGVYLLLILFSINIILGGLIRLRRKPSNIGIFIIHGGIVFMLLGGLIEFKFKNDGQMTLAPRQTSNQFQSYHDWELAVVDTGEGGLEYMIDQEHFNGLRRGESRRFSNDAFPYDLTISGYVANGMVQPKGPMFEAPTDVIDDFFVRPLPRERENERNFPALYLTLTDKGAGEERREILWGRSLMPLTVEAGGKPWNISLRRKTWVVPFDVTLKKFIREDYPGTQIPRRFQSDIIKTEDGVDQAISIRMNQPLRHRGYTFFQSSYIEDPNGGETLSVFAVVRNPADKFPLWSCVIITVGMLLHFSLRLVDYLKRERLQAT